MYVDQAKMSLELIPDLKTVVAGLSGSKEIGQHVERSANPARLSTSMWQQELYSAWQMWSKLWVEALLTASVSVSVGTIPSPSYVLETTTVCLIYYSMWGREGRG